MRLTLFVVLAASITIARAQDPRKPASTITGRVVDGQGKPVAGAAIGLFAPGEFIDTPRLLAKPPAVTAEDGTYAIDARPSARWGRLVVAARRYQSCSVQIPEHLATGGPASEHILAPGGRLVGRVQDESGQPIAGARVRVRSSIVDHQDYLLRPEAGASTDAKGRFVVPCIPRKGLHVSVEAEGYIPAARLVLAHSPTFSLERIGVVRGKVVATDGKPIAGISVNGVIVERPAVHSSVVSANDGTFTITVPKKGRFRIAGSERKPPYRQFSSDLLHGPMDGVVLTENTRGPKRRTIEVSVVDAATKTSIPEFWLRPVFTNPARLQTVLFHGAHRRRLYEKIAKVIVSPRADRLRGVVVEAPGFGFEVVPLTDDPKPTLMVALGPEAVLTGRVVDAQTGAPMPGVAIRALPKGRASGTGGRWQDAGPRSDKDGRYRLRGLRPGAYGVQAHAAGRPASEPVFVTVAAGKENTADLTVPKECWLEFELTGAVPAGASCSVQCNGSGSSGSTPGFFQHHLPARPPLVIKGPGRYRLGPVVNRDHGLVLYRKSRVRIGTGTTFRLGNVQPNRPATKVALPDLETTLVHGRVVLPADVPCERVAVLATRAGDRRRLWITHRPNVAGLDANGDFVLDLSSGSYTVQLADLATGIVFHTEPTDLATEDMTDLKIEPDVRWLEVTCKPKQEGAPVVLNAFSVHVRRPRKGCRAWIRSWRRKNDIETGSVPFRLGQTEQRWLVPRGRIDVEARQTFEILEPWSSGYQAVEVAKESVDVQRPMHRIELAIPAPPTDTELRQTWHRKR